MSKLKVALVTRWGAPCGISTYSEELSEYLVQEDVILQILAAHEEGSCISQTPISIPARQVWQPNNMATPYEVTLASQGVDLVHIQHEFGLFSNEVFLQMLQDLRQAGKKVVVTLHTVYPYGSWQRSGFFDAVRSYADAVLTHTPAATSSLILARGKAKVFWMPHGCITNPGKGDREKGLRLLNIQEKYWDATFGGAFGFIGYGKNLHTTMKAFAEAISRRLIGNCGFIICGEVRDANYYQNLEGIKNASGYLKNFFIVPGFIARDDVCHILAAFDFSILNTTSWDLSSSGQAQRHAAHGIPLAVANRPIYNQAIQAGAIPFEAGESDSMDITMINAIAALANNKLFRRDISNSLRIYARSIGWDVIAKKHAAIYKSVLECN